MLAGLLPPRVRNAERRADLILASPHRKSADPNRHARFATAALPRRVGPHGLSTEITVTHR